MPFFLIPYGKGTGKLWLLGILILIVLLASLLTVCLGVPEVSGAEGAEHPLVRHIIGLSPGRKQMRTRVN